VNRRASSSAVLRRHVDRFRALCGDPAASQALAREILAAEANAELLLAALNALAGDVRFEDHDLLRNLYAWLEHDFRRRDPGGTIRVEVLRLLWHLRSREDLDLAEAASSRVEVTVNGRGEMLRAAGLALMGVLDPDAAAYRAAAILAAVDAHPMNAEPALTAARLLGALGQTVALTAHVLRPPRSEPAEVTAECLRGLAGQPVRHILPVLELYAGAEDDVILLGLADLVVSLEAGETVDATVRRMLAGTATPEGYEFLVTAIVASRRADLIAVLLGTLPGEVLEPRLRAARRALGLAPAAPEVLAAIGALDVRLGVTRGSPDRARE
jgi:hypothetical protein